MVFKMVSIYPVTVSWDTSVQHNRFQERERRYWPERFRYLTPRHSLDLIYCIEEHHRLALLNVLDQAVQDIQVGRYAEAVERLFDPQMNVLTQANIYYRNVPIKSHNTLADIKAQITALKKRGFTNGCKGRVIDLIRLTFDQSSSHQVSLNFSSAYIALEEWLHFLQNTFEIPISRKYQSHSKDFVDKEADITAFFIEQGLPLPNNHFELHPCRKREFPHWQRLLSSQGSHFEVIEWDD